MTTYQLLLISSALASIATPISAETFNYTKLEVSYELMTADINGVSEDLEGDGVNLNLSFSISPNVAIYAGYGTGTADITSGGTTLEADIDAGGIGILYHTPINNTADFVAGFDLSQGNIDIKVNGSLFSSEDADGNSIFVGIRTMALHKLELNAYIDRSNIEDSTNTDLEFGAALYIDRSTSLNANYSFDSDENTLSFGASKYF